MKEKIDELIEKVKNPPSWWWKVLGGLLLVAFVIFIKYQLDKQAQENAALRTQLEKNKLEAEQRALRAKLLTNETDSNIAQAEAQDLLNAAQRALSDLEAKEKATQIEMKRLNAVKAKDWDALNKLAGV